MDTLELFKKLIIDTYWILCRKAYYSDINYGKILKIKKAEIKEPEKSVSMDFDFDLE